MTAHRRPKTVTSISRQDAEAMACRATRMEAATVQFWGPALAITQALKMPPGISWLSCGVNSSVRVRGTS